MRIYVSSLGCKLNQSEMDALAARLAGLGHQVVTSPVEAEVCVLNTCAVTHVAAQKSRQALRRLHRENPGARLVATGCYAELSPADLQALAGVHLVAGNEEKARLATLLDAWDPDSGWHPTDWPSGARPPIARTRAFVKIQDGCDNACTYCVIRLARGPQQSRPAGDVLHQVKACLAAGHQEVVLTGVHIGAYGHDVSRHEVGDDLWGLVARILAETDVPRLRLSSIEPWDLPDTAYSLWGDPRLCPHLHLPLQSGCDRTLRRMGRRYTTAEFRAVVDAARAAIPDLAVTTDVMAGFPGETEENFRESLDFVRAMEFARVHVFPYSRRPGTSAASLPEQVPSPVKADWAKLMRSAGTDGEQAYQQQFVGRTMGVLWESSRQNESGWVWSGLTGNYLRVWASSVQDLSNSVLPTRLVGLTRGGLEGRVVI
jgi:threonylcarbamoyladenosine tRNA methylthiotransferase MtaB